MRYFNYILTLILAAFSINELIKVLIKVMNEDSFQKVNENQFERLLSPSITLCPGPAWKKSGPFRNPEDFR